MAGGKEKKKKGWKIPVQSLDTIQKRSVTSLKLRRVWAERLIVLHTCDQGGR